MKKCAVINDISGFGKCSLSAGIPVLSALGIQVNPVVTAVLSNQTGYDSYYMNNLDDYIVHLIDEWKKIGACFDGILSGFLSNEKQFEYVKKFINEFKRSDTLFVVDPVMADDGKLYDNYTKNMCLCVKEICTYANVITPNATELSVLCGAEYSDDVKIITDYAKSLLKNDLRCVIVTGIINEDKISTVCVCNNQTKVFSAEYIKNESFSGTGDLFSSVITGCLLNGKSAFESVEIAQNFVVSSIKETPKGDSRNGICFESNLPLLYKSVKYKEEGALS